MYQLVMQWAVVFTFFLSLLRKIILHHCKAFPIIHSVVFNNGHVKQIYVLIKPVCNSLVPLFKY